MGNEIISRLTTAFSVKDIMTPVQQLKRADTIESAHYLFHEYDIVPYPRHNLIEGFLDGIVMA